MKKIISYHKYLVAFAAGLIILSSCNKYLDIQPKGKQLLKATIDYDQWLNSTDLENCLPPELNKLGDNEDNVSLTATSVLTGAPLLAYLWFPQFDPNVTAPPIIWGPHYKSIYYYNTVILEADASEGGTPQQKASLKAEALLGRAFEYLYLVNEYGKLYNATTANSDLAVPFVVSNDLGTATPQRSTVQQIYDHIISDINTAIPDLPANNNKNRYRGSVAAAYSVLARTYLYMRNYPQALKYAQMALTNGPNAIVDYNISVSADAVGTLITRTDAVYARLSTVYAVNELPTLEFLRMFDKNDLRLKGWYNTTADPNFTGRGKTSYTVNTITSTGNYANWGISVAELRLMVAECAARANDLTTALQQLDLVRKCRIAKAFYTPFSSTDQAVVLQTVLNERQMEMPYNGTRWFDMRRLDAEGRMPTVNRLNGSATVAGTVIATLAPGSPRYTLQIPLQVMYYNPDWPQNP